jgi:predicted MFS family arabinose efflux permease
VASVFGVPFSLFLANHYDWHSPFMFLGTLALFIAVIVALKLPNMKAHLKGPHIPEERKPFFALKALLKNKSELIALSFTFSLVFGQFSIIPFLSPSFVMNGGLAEDNLPLVYLFGGIVSMFASPTFGRLADKFGKKKIFYFGATLSTIPMIWITHLGAMSTTALLLVSSSFFLVMGGRMVPAMALISSVPHPRFRASFMSVNASMQQLAAALASYCAGYIVIKNEQGHLLHYEWVGYLGVIFTFVAIWAVRKVKPYEAVK